MSKTDAGKIETGKIETGPVHINKLVESRDLDGCLGYLSLVNGINGAVLYNSEGLVMGSGEDTHESLYIEAPYFLSGFMDTLDRTVMLGLGPVDHAVTFTESRFHLIINIEQCNLFFMVVTGTRGSYELFKFRIERGAQAIARLLHARGYIRG
jgi:predicted regulator of Ras-like GTPase activity (Roadblock/LC7/MglB family)